MKSACVWVSKAAQRSWGRRLALVVPLARPNGQRRRWNLDVYLGFGYLLANVQRIRRIPSALYVDAIDESSDSWHANYFAWTPAVILSTTS